MEQTNKKMKVEKKNDEYMSHKGLIALIICAIVSIALAIVCIFFPEEFFGLFIK